ncbi:MAG: acetyltransferase [Gammaproteobacteria bacterium]|nr:acetyltransferase [Gammaproteobacteria bacterium]
MSFPTLISLISLTLITSNLLFWLLPLSFIAVLKACLPIQPVNRFTQSLVDRIYRYAEAFDSWWLQKGLGLEIKITGASDKPITEHLIVTSNHRSWFDILILQKVVLERAPIIRFLVKRQLRWVPVVGWICLALDFPALGRSQHNRQQDLEHIRKASQSPDRHHWSLMNFPEGTRFTAEKKLKQESPYQNLLNPKWAGMATLLQCLPNAQVLDVTLIYPQMDTKPRNFWHCLSGQLPFVTVYLHYETASDIKDPHQWLQNRWQAKDKLIQEALSQHSND